MAKTLSSPRKAPGFDLWSGNLIPHATTKIWCSQINKFLSIDLKTHRERACTNTGVTMFGDWKILYYKDVVFKLCLKKKKKKDSAKSDPCNPTDCSLPGSSVHEILQARILEWVAISTSRRISQPRD